MTDLRGLSNINYSDHKLEREIGKKNVFVN